jgi:hypothetical protein
MAVQLQAADVIAFLQSAADVNTCQLVDLPDYFQQFYVHLPSSLVGSAAHTLASSVHPSIPALHCPHGQHRPSFALLAATHALTS